MPIRFEQEHFTSDVTQLISHIYTAINNQDRPIIIKQLLNLEEELVRMYRSREDFTFAQAKIRAQEVYLALIQSFVHYVCQNIQTGHPEHLCNILTSQAENLFFVDLFYEVGPSHGVLWLDENEEISLLEAVELRGFGTLMQQLVNQAILAIAKDTHQEETRPLKAFLHLIEIKRELLIHVNAKLSIHWNKHEERLNKSWQRLLLSFYELKITDPQQQLLLVSQRLPLSGKERESLVKWLERLSSEVTSLLISFPDPIVRQSLIDKERALQQATPSARAPEDPMCFLVDRHPYFLSSIQRLQHPTERTIISPILHKSIPVETLPSNTLQALYHLSQNILNIKQYVLVNETISLEDIGKLAFSLRGHMPRAQIHTPIAPPVLAGTPSPIAHPAAPPNAPQRRATGRTLSRDAFWQTPMESGDSASHTTPPPPYDAPAYPTPGGPSLHHD
jgi:hypothetical protein